MLMYISCHIVDTDKQQKNSMSTNLQLYITQKVYGNALQQKKLNG